MTTRTTAAPKARDREAPAKRWRNAYWLSRPVRLRESAGHAGGVYGPGRFVSRCIWPSAEVAEAHAMKSLAHSENRDWITYLGPEPA